MRRPGDGWVVLASLAAGASLALALKPKVLPPPPQPAPVQGPRGDDRIRYPVGQVVELPMPDGKALRVRSVLNVTRRMQFGDYVWDDKTVPQGPVRVRIDLANQMISVFRGGHEIGSAVIIYGTDGKPTPVGNFPIIERAQRHRSSLYDAEMPFMLRLTPDGVAIHASTVRERAATHGCIGIPYAFARLLFVQAKRGDVVAILPGTARDRS